MSFRLAMHADTVSSPTVPNECLALPFTNDGVTQRRRYFLLLWQSFQFHSHFILASPGTILLVGEFIVWSRG